MARLDGMRVVDCSEVRVVALEQGCMFVCLDDSSLGETISGCATYVSTERELTRKENQTFKLKRDSSKREDGQCTLIGSFTASDKEIAIAIRGVLKLSVHQCLSLRSKTRHWIGDWPFLPPPLSAGTSPRSLPLSAALK